MPLHSCGLWTVRIDGVEIQHVIGTYKGFNIVIELRNNGTWFWYAKYNDGLYKMFEIGYCDTFRQARRAVKAWIDDNAGGMRTNEQY